MARDISAQIMAKVWFDASFAQVLRGPEASGTIQEALGVSWPAGAALPDIPPAPEEVGTQAGLGVQTGVRAGRSRRLFIISL